MNILHVLSQVQPTGAEYYAATLADSQIDEGHKVIIISDTFTSPTNAEYVKMPLGNRRWPQRFRNVSALKRFLKENSIDVVHAHSRASSWVANLALKRTKIPLISTVHGRQSIHFSSRNFNTYGDRIIAVCENLKIHLVEGLNIKPGQIDVLPNPFDFTKITFPPIVNIKGQKILSIIGRTNDQKGRRVGELVENVFEHLLEEFPELQIKIIGGKVENLPETSRKKLVELEGKFPGRIHCLGFIHHIYGEIAKSNIVIAAGRVAIESLLIGRETIALGENSYIGPVNESSLKEAIDTNFGDSTIEYVGNVKLGYERISNDLSESLRHNEAPNLFEAVKSHYSLDYISKAVIDIYQSEIMRKHIPK